MTSSTNNPQNSNHFTKEENDEKVPNDHAHLATTTSTSTTSTPVNFAQLVVDISGAWGRWQLRLFLLFLLLSLFSCWHALQLAFLAPKLDFWCVKVEEVVKGVSDHHNFPLNIENLSPNKTLNQCEYFHQNESTALRCTAWNFDVHPHPNAFYHSTIVSEWSLVCGQKWLAGLAHSVYMIGSLASSLLMGHASDRFGRRPTMAAGWAISLVATVGGAFAGNFPLFLACRLLIAFGLVALYSSGFVLLLEVTGPQYRESIGLAVNFGWAAGYVSLPWIAYLLADFRHLLMVCAGVQLTLVVPGYLWLTESPRWLLANGRYQEAIEVLKGVVRVNGGVGRGGKRSSLNNNNNNESNNSESWEEQVARFQKEKKLANEKDTSTSEKKATANYSVLSLFTGGWALARMTLLVYLIWYANTLVYYGLSLNTAVHLAGDPFLNFFLLGAIEVPSYVASIYAVKWAGCRKTLIATMFGAALGCWACPLASAAFPDTPLLGVAAAMAGKFCVTASFAVVYVYATQLFPTVVRSIALGSSSVVGRLGSICAPYIGELASVVGYGGAMGVVGLVAAAAGLAVFPLAEATGTDMPDRPEDIEMSAVTAVVENESLKKDEEN